MEDRKVDQVVGRRVVVERCSNMAKGIILLRLYSPFDRKKIVSEVACCVLRVHKKKSSKRVRCHRFVVSLQGLSNGEVPRGNGSERESHNDTSWRKLLDPS